MSASRSAHGWTADSLLEAFQRMIRKQDYWRGYAGDEITDDEAVDLLQEARDALAASKRAYGLEYRR